MNQNKLLFAALFASGIIPALLVAQDSRGTPLPVAKATPPSPSVARRAPAGKIVFVCGKGNNGGDGIVAARLLRQAGRDVEVLLVWPPEWMGEDAQAQLEKLPAPKPVQFEAGKLHKAHVIVDCLLGTGSSGSARSPADQVIAEMEAAKAPVIACDVPSGVDATTGEVEGPAGLFARVSLGRGLTFALRQPAQVLHAQLDAHLTGDHLHG